METNHDIVRKLIHLRNKMYIDIHEGSKDMQRSVNRGNVHYMSIPNEDGDIIRSKTLVFDPNKKFVKINKNDWNLFQSFITDNINEIKDLTSVRFGPFKKNYKSKLILICAITPLALFMDKEKKDWFFDYLKSNTDSIQFFTLLTIFERFAMYNICQYNSIIHYTDKGFESYFKLLIESSHNDVRLYGEKTEPDSLKYFEEIYNDNCNKNCFNESLDFKFSNKDVLFSYLFATSLSQFYKIIRILKIKTFNFLIVGNRNRLSGLTENLGYDKNLPSLLGKVFNCISLHYYNDLMDLKEYEFYRENIFNYIFSYGCINKYTLSSLLSQFCYSFKDSLFGSNFIEKATDLTRLITIDQINNKEEINLVFDNISNPSFEDFHIIPVINKDQINKYNFNIRKFYNSDTSYFETDDAPRTLGKLKYKAEKYGNTKIVNHIDDNKFIIDKLFSYMNDSDKSIKKIFYKNLISIENRRSEFYYRNSQTNFIERYKMSQELVFEIRKSIFGIPLSDKCTEDIIELTEDNIVGIIASENLSQRFLLIKNNDGKLELRNMMYFDVLYKRFRDNVKELETDNLFIKLKYEDMYKNK